MTVNGRSTDKRQITYDYDRLGRLAKVIRPLTSPSRSGIAYSYNIQGWVDKIETGSFSESLHYNEGPGRHLFNGNVSSVNWSRKGEAGNRGYKFDYDRLNRLTGAEYGEKDFSLATGRYDEQLRYDADGNVQALSRNGRKQNGSYGPVDDLTLSYDGCQLSAVEERAAPVVSANSYDLKRGSDDFAYNDNGALTMDGTRGITNITYDYGGFPARVQFDNGNVTKYVYTSTGQKLRAVYYTAMPNVRVGMGMDYDGIEDNHLSVDSVDYLLGGTVLCRNGRATQILFDGGYVKVERRLPGLWKNPSLLSLIPNVPIITNDSLVLQPNPADTLRLTFKYFNKDHLGNIREVIGEDGTVEQVTDYYPFGLPIGDLGRNGGLQRFKYNGKEFDEMHGLNTYDYGARQYNPVLARWDRMDPLAEKYPHLSAYCYAADNPIRYIDPDGRKIVFAPGSTKIFKTKFSAAVQLLKEHKVDGIIAQLEKSSTTIYIAERIGVPSGFQDSNKTIYWDPNMGIITTSDKALSPTTILNHEADHALQYIVDPVSTTQDFNTDDLDYDNREERRVITGSEQRTALALGEIKEGEVTRTDHLGQGYVAKEPTTTEPKDGKQMKNPWVLEEIVISSNKTNK